MDTCKICTEKVPLNYTHKLKVLYFLLSFSAAGLLSSLSVFLTFNAYIIPLHSLQILQQFPSVSAFFRWFQVGLRAFDTQSINKECLHFKEIKKTLGDDLIKRIINACCLRRKLV